MSVHSLVEKSIKWFKPDPANLKLHSDIQVEQIVASIQRFGFRDPIATDDKGNIIEGHGRYEAAKRLMMKKVPCIVLTGMTPTQLKAYGIAHNQTTLNSGLDNTAVKEEFQRLEVDETDFVSLGYTAEDGAFLLDDTPGGGTQDRGERKENTDPAVTTLHFGSKAQFDQFANFLTVLRLRYPDRTSIAARLDAFATEYGSNL